MEDVVLYVIDNYKWLSIALALVIMFIVGYIADATDFGRNKTNKKVKKEKKVKEEVEEYEEPQQVSEINLNEDLNVPFGDTTVSTPKVDLNEDLNVPFGDQTIAKVETPVEQPISEDLTTELTDLPIPSLDEITEAPVVEEEQPVVEEEKTVEEEKPKKKVKKVKEVKSKKSKKEQATYQEDVLPEVITENYNDDTVSSDDDIWKF